jgi:hypothetical protein
MFPHKDFGTNRCFLGRRGHFSPTNHLLWGIHEPATVHPLLRLLDPSQNRSTTYLLQETKMHTTYKSLTDRFLAYKYYLFEYDAKAKKNLGYEGI